MQKIEYTCDRCHRVTSADQMWKLRLESVYINPTTSKKGLEGSAEILDGLERSFKHLYQDLCNDCRGELGQWIERGPMK